MLLKILGGILACLAVVQASPVGRYSSRITQEDFLFILQAQCFQATERLPADQWEFLRESLLVYDNVSYSAQDKIHHFEVLLSDHNLTSTPNTAMELYSMFILTDYSGDVHNRTAQLVEVVEIQAPELFEDEDVKDIMTTVLSVPLKIGDKVFKELGRIKGEEMKKTAQKQMRNLVLSQEYLGGSEKQKQLLIARIIFCFIQSIGEEHSLIGPLNIFRRFQ